MEATLYYINGSRHSRKARELVESTPDLDVALRNFWCFGRAYGYDRDNVLPQLLPALYVEGLKGYIEGLSKIQKFLGLYKALFIEEQPVLIDRGTGELYEGLDGIEKFIERFEQQNHN